MVLLHAPAVAQDGEEPWSIQVNKTAEPDSLPEPGADVTFTVLVEKTSEARVTVTSFFDSSLGDLAIHTQSTCSVPQKLAPSGQEGSSYSCTFTAFVGGDPGIRTNTVTVSGVDGQGGVVSAFATTGVEIIDVIWFIELSKTVFPTVLVELGGLVTYTVRVSNPSDPGGPAPVTSLVDSLYGDLLEPDNPNISNNTCEPVTLEAGGTYSCAFQTEVTGSAGDRVTGIMTATSLMQDPASASVRVVAQRPSTGIGVVPSFVTALLAAAGTMLAAVGAWVRLRSR